MIKVTVWNEFVHEKESEKVKAIYPGGIHNTSAEFLGREEDIEVRVATLDDEECGLTEEVLRDTDVLVWWGHVAHGRVPDEIVERAQKEVLKGMGAIFLHSAHHCSHGAFGPAHALAQGRNQLHQRMGLLPE